MALSPDGSRVAYITPLSGQGTAVEVLPLAKDARPKVAVSANGNPERLRQCSWVSNDRLVCELFWIGPAPDLLPFTRLLAVNTDGSNVKILTKERNFWTHGLALGGEEIIDWLPDEDGAVLMSRIRLPDDRLGSRLGNSNAGFGVERIDTRTLAASSVKSPTPEAIQYISDGHGTVRIMAERMLGPNDTDTGSNRYLYRAKGSETWHELCTFNYLQRSGFLPVAVDRDLDAAYGWKKKDGRLALYTMMLDGTGRENLVYASDEVDVTDLIKLGRRHRVVGISYVTDYRRAVFTDPAIGALNKALSKALPGKSIRIADASLDESKLLVHATSDVDPGVYYVFDRNSHHLDTFLVNRAELEGVTLARVEPVTYPAKDGTAIPGYLTLPPGKSDSKGLPAIVLPHGGPGARDEWGFDWLAQFFAARGYAVLQPNFRGSAGYGDAWFRTNGFQSWETAIGDVLDAGRWLISQGADSNRLAVFGWSYGGYAALQSVVVDNTLFKAAVAVAPVTDLATLVAQYRDWSNYYLESDFVGHGPHVKAGSPAQNAARIKVPVLLFHGTQDINVRIVQSQMMDQALAAAGARHELVTFPGLDHQLEDSAARAELLRRSDAFLHSAFGH